MKFLRTFLILPFIATSPHLAAQGQDVLMARYRFSFPMTGDHGRTSGEVIYANAADEHPGPKGLIVNVPSKYDVQRDEDGVLQKIISVPHELVIRPSEQEWAAEDPDAFDITYGYSHGGPAIRTHTVARLQVDGAAVIVMKSIFHGLRAEDTQSTNIQPGETTRAEFTSPEPGLSILTRGREINGKFVPETRNTRIRFRDNNLLRLHRIIDERFRGDTGEWTTTSDVLREWKQLEGQWQETRNIYDPDGAAITEEWEYYSRGERTSEDGHTSDGSRLKRHLQRDGVEVHHQYLKNGKITETRYPNGSVRIFSELSEEVGEDTRVRTAIDMLDGVEVSRVVKEFAPAKHTFTTLIPGRPERVQIWEYYPKGHEFGGSERRIFYPDGTLKTIERTRLEDGNSSVVEEYGTHDGERVIEGTRTTIVFGDRPDSGKTTERIDRR